MHNPNQTRCSNFTRLFLSVLILVWLALLSPVGHQALHSDAASPGHSCAAAHPAAGKCLTPDPPALAVLNGTLILVPLPPQTPPHSPLEARLHHSRAPPSPAR